MEPRAAIATYDKSADHYTLYTSLARIERHPRQDCRDAENARRQIARHYTRCGGRLRTEEFRGRRTGSHPDRCEGVWRPIKWVGERMEAFLGDGHGRDVKMKGELALDANARILALRLDSAANMGAYMTHVGPHIPTSGLRVMGGVYRVPAVYARVRGYFTNTSTVTSYRGAGRPEAIYVTERLMDQAAPRRSAWTRWKSATAISSRVKSFPYRNWKGTLDRLRRFCRPISTKLRAVPIGTALLRASGNPKRAARSAAAASPIISKRQGGPPGQRAREVPLHRQWRGRSLFGDAVERAGARDDIRAARVGTPWACRSSP
jgi:hypothetical protein